MQSPFSSANLSPATLKALVDVISGGPGNGAAQSIGVYRTGGQIEGLMMECNLDFRVGMNFRVTALLDFDTVQQHLERALKSADDDPEDAVTAACSILESVCRSILVELRLELRAKKDIDGLVKAVQEPLRLSPGRTDLPEEIASDIRQILGGLTSTAKGIGALRTHAGDAHGRERGFKRVEGRIARLAIHSASTLALFLIETWEKKQKRPLPQESSARLT
jgi:Abortive infection C-terminus